MRLGNTKLTSCCQERECMIGQLAELRLDPDQRGQQLVWRRGQMNRMCSRSNAHGHHCRRSREEGVGHDGVYRKDGVERQLYITTQPSSNATKMQILTVSTRSPADGSIRAHSASQTYSIGVQCNDGGNESSEDSQEQGKFHLYCEEGGQRQKPAKVEESWKHLTGPWNRSFLFIVQCPVCEFSARRLTKTGQIFLRWKFSSLLGRTT